MFLVVRDVEIDAQVAEGVGETGQRTVAYAADLVLFAVDGDDAVEASFEVPRILRLACFRRHGARGAIGRDIVVHEAKPRVRVQVIRLFE